jgi:serine/threonine protein kinase
LQPNNILTELETIQSAVAPVLDTTPSVLETLVLPSGTSFDVVECSQIPLEIPSHHEDWDVKAKIADLGMGVSMKLPRVLTLPLGNFIGDPWLTLIQPEFLRAPEVILGCKWGSAADIWSLGCIVLCGNGFELMEDV